MRVGEQSHRIGSTERIWSETLSANSGPAFCQASPLCFQPSIWEQAADRAHWSVNDFFFADLGFIVSEHLCRLSVKGRGSRAEPQNSLPWKPLSEMPLAVGNAAFFLGPKQAAEKAGWSKNSRIGSQAELWSSKVGALNNRNRPYLMHLLRRYCMNWFDDVAST